MHKLVSGLGGSLTALVTPFRDNQVDWGALAELCGRQIDCGTAALIVCGSTGEAAALTQHEYSHVIRFVVETVAERVPVIAGCTAMSTAATVSLGLKAASANADALLCAVPPYVKPTPEGIVVHIRTIAQVTDLPIVLYDVPSRSSTPVSDDVVSRLHHDGLIVGIKDATADLSRPPRLRARCGDAFVQWSGDDATAPAHRAMGGDGCISVTANVTPALCALLHNAWDKGDLGRFASLRDFAASAACRPVRGEQPDSGQGGTVQSRPVCERDAAASHQRHAGHAGTAASGDGAAHAGRGTCQGLPLRDGRLKRLRRPGNPRHLPPLYGNPMRESAGQYGKYMLAIAT